MSDLLERQSFEPLARALRQRSSAIIERWEQMVRETLPAADKLTLAQVRDEIPNTLARLADALASDTPDQTRSLISQTNTHGSERFHQGYNVEELVIEYRLLRRVLIEEVESALQRRTTKDEDLVLSMGVDTVLQEGVVTFVNYQAAELSAAGDAEARFLSYLSHDLRNQLNHVSLVLEILITKLGNTPALAGDVAEIQDARRAIFDTVEGMESILKAARLRKGTTELKLAPVDLRQLVQAAVNAFAREAAAKGLTLATDMPPVATCMSDRRLLLLILHNLLSNAIKYSERGTVRVSLEPADEQTWCLRVADEGPGIRPEQQQRIFDEFVRGDTRGQAGMGLGLAIASRAAKLLNAKLSVESAPGAGSVFEACFPCGTADGRA